MSVSFLNVILVNKGLNELYDFYVEHSELSIG